MKQFILKGNILYSKNINHIETIHNGYIICDNGKCRGAFKNIPEKYTSFPLHDYGDMLIIPGLSDLHIHAPQFSFRGLGMDYELLDWLNNCAFPEEIKYSNIEYAQKKYPDFTRNLFKSATTRACIFGTVHKNSTLLLADLLDKAGLSAYVGMVNMDRNAPAELCENTDNSKENLINFITQMSKYETVKCILTPRFIPCCSDNLLDTISNIQKKYNLPVQSHLSENPSEKKWVQQLCPYSDFYGDAYDKHQLFGLNHNTNKKFNTVMAHCVYSDDDEIRLMAENNVFVAHCPASNTNLASGIAPVRKLLENNVKIGLGSDVAGGHTTSILRAVTDSVQVSKLYWRIYDDTKKYLTFAEAFFLATKGGGEFFGKVGSFENDYDFDAVILDDSSINNSCNLSLQQRLERFAYLSLDVNGVYAKYVNGKKLF